MAKASDNEYPSVLFTAGVADPSTPGADTVRVYFKNGDPYWINAGGTATQINAADISSSNLADLNNVGTATPTDGQVLTYATATSTWEPSAAAGGGGKSYVTEPGLRPPDSAATGDIEFIDYANATSATGTPGMTWGNQGSATGTINQGRLVMNSTTTTSLRGLFIATPGAGNFDVTTAFKTTQWQDFQWAGLVMLWGTPASPTAIRAAGRYFSAAAGDVETQYVYTTYNTSFAATADDANVTIPVYPSWNYIRIEWDGTNLIFYGSPTATEGTWLGLTSQTEGLGRPDYIGVGVNTNGATNASIAEFAFLRFNWAADFDPTTDD